MHSRHLADSGFKVLTALLLITAPLSAQDDNPGKKAYLDDLAAVEGKYVALAEAIPESAYAWRPTEGVRSVGEVFTHVAAANYMFGQILGTPMPADVKAKYPNAQAYSAVTNKAEIVALLRASFAHGRNVLTAITDQQFNSKVNMFGRETPFPSALLSFMTHNHEHLGQTIAYARSNKVTPPWNAGN